MIKLTELEIHSRMTELHPDWNLKEEFLHRELVFKNFVEAFSFMTAVALIAEKVAHHPNWQNTYNKLTINLSTHDAGSITNKDFDLAGAIDKLYKN